jgi:hypothetical protein
VKYSFGTGAKDDTCCKYPRYTALYLLYYPLAYRFRVAIAGKTLADVDIHDLRDSKECSVEVCSPDLTMKYAGGKQKLYLRFRLRQNYDRVVALLERMGVELKQSGPGPESTRRVGSLQTGVGTPAQLGIASQNHFAMEKMAAPAQIGSTTPSSTYIPSWYTQHLHQRQLQPNQPHSQPDPRNSHHPEFVPYQQTQQSTVTNQYPPSRLISDRPHQDQHLDMPSISSRQIQFSAVKYPRDPETRQRDLTALETSQQEQMSMQQQYDPKGSSNQQQRANMQVQNLSDLTSCLC